MVEEHERIDITGLDGKKNKRQGKWVTRRMNNMENR